MNVELSYSAESVRLGKIGIARWTIIAAPVLFVVCMVTYLPRLGELGLYLDDWRNLGDFISTGHIAERTARPVNLAILNWGWELFHLNITAYLVVSVGLLFLSSLAIWLLLYVLLPQNYNVLALPMAALYLVYPSYYIRVWYTLWPTGLLIMLVVGGILAYVAFLRRAHAGWLVLALLLLGTSLLWYELQLGLIAVLPILGVTRLRTASWWRRLLIVSPTLLAGFFAIWWVLAPVSSKEYQTQRLSLSPLLLVERFVGSYFTILPVSWIEPLRFVGPRQFERWQAVSIFVALLAAALLITFWVVRRRSKRRDEQPIALRQYNWLPLLQCVAVAIVAIGAGVLVALPLTLISVKVLDSRYTMFAALGAAALVVLLLYALGLLVTRRLNSSVEFAYILSSALVLLSVFYQWEARSALITAWDRQKCAWSSMFAQAPSFADGTYVHIIDVPSAPGILGVPPFHSLASEVNVPLKLFYGNATLVGTYADQQNTLLSEGNGFNLAPEGLQEQRTGKVVPYAQSVIFRYRSDNSLELLKEVPPELSGAATPSPTGYDRILAVPADSPYRQVLGPEPICSNGTAEAQPIRPAQEMTHG